MRLPPEEVPMPLPKAVLSFAEGEDARIVAHLASIGLLEVIEDSIVWEHAGTLVLSGFFGVEKRGETVSEAEGRPKLRLICNLKPSNACQCMVGGNLELLPCSTQWNSIQLEEYETLLLSSSDRQCFLYLQHAGCLARGHCPQWNVASRVVRVGTCSGHRGPRPGGHRGAPQGLDFVRWHLPACARELVTTGAGAS